MLMFKSCPRCLGDRSLERDLYGWYVVCLACGHVSYPENQPTYSHHQRRLQEAT